MRPFGSHVMPAGLEGFVASTTVGEETAYVRSRINIDRNEGLPDGQFGVWEDGA